MKIHCLQHVAFEPCGTIAGWAQANHHQLSYTYFFNQQYQLPSLPDVDALVVLGGYMNVAEEGKYTWLAPEKQLIQQAVAAGKKVLGISLGTQLIAAALGAAVYRNKEIEAGFFPVHFTAEALAHPLFHHYKHPPYMQLHWHGDTFNLPEGATLLASSAACRHQAFAIGSQVLALQYHAHADELLVSNLLHFEGRHLQPAKQVQAREVIQQQAQLHLPSIKKNMYCLLDKFLTDDV
ncbi:MAG: hypothetical protein RL172_1983 [Bacteroidota bacterium]